MFYDKQPLFFINISFWEYSFFANMYKYELIMKIHLSIPIVGFTETAA